MTRFGRRLQVGAQQDREVFHFAFIGTDFTCAHKTEFDAGYIRHLFQYAYALSAHGYAWRNQLPNMTQSMRLLNITPSQQALLNTRRSPGAASRWSCSSLISVNTNRSIPYLCATKYEAKPSMQTVRF